MSTQGFCEHISQLFSSSHIPCSDQPQLDLAYVMGKKNKETLGRKGSRTQNQGKVADPGIKQGNQVSRESYWRLMTAGMEAGRGQVAHAPAHRSCPQGENKRVTTHGRLFLGWNSFDK